MYHRGMLSNAARRWAAHRTRNTYQKKEEEKKREEEESTSNII